MNSFDLRSLCRAFLAGVIFLLPVSSLAQFSTRGSDDFVPHALRVSLQPFSLLSAESQAAVPTTTVLTVEPARHVSSLEPVVLTATVDSGGHPVFPGIVTFCDASARFCEGQAILGTASLTANGTAFIKKVLSPGVHRVYALFNLTQADAGSKSEPQTIEVGPRIPTTTVLSKLPASLPDSLQATITSTGTPPITGPVALYDDAKRRRMVTEVRHSELTSSFAPFSSYASAEFPNVPLELISEQGVVSGDFNGDGLMDIAVSAIYGSLDTAAAGIAIFLNDPSHPGQFLPGTTIYEGGADFNLIAADFNHDGLTDLAFQCLDEFTAPAECVMMNDPSHPGQFLFTSFPTQSNFMQAVDMNQDGVLDLVGTSSSRDIDIIFGDPANPGQFINETSFPDGSAFSVAAADVNGDGVQDVVAVGEDPNGVSGVSVFLGDPHNPGKLLAPVFYPTGAFSGPTDVVMGDFNDDGLPDIAVGLFTGEVAILLNRQDAPGQFVAPISYPIGEYPYSLALGAFHRSDSQDIAVIGGSDLYVLPADPLHPGEFLSAVKYPLMAGEFAIGVTTADYNVDGLDDLGISEVTADQFQYTFDLGVLLSQPMQTATVDFPSLSNQRFDSTAVHADYLGDLNHLGSRSCPIDIHTGAATPEINDLGVHDIRRNSANITWWGNTTTATVAYGVTASLGSIAALRQQSPGKSDLPQDISLEGLMPATKYYYRLTSSLAVTGCPTTTSTSATLSFTTAR